MSTALMDRPEALTRRQEILREMDAIDSESLRWHHLEEELESLNALTGIHDCTSCGKDFNAAVWTVVEHCPTCAVEDLEDRAYIAVTLLAEMLQDHKEDCPCMACLFIREVRAQDGQ